LEHKNKLLNNFEILKNKHEELSKELQEIRHNHKSIKFHEKAEKNTFKVSNQLNDELSNNLNKLLISIEKLEIKSTSWYLKPFQKLYTTTSDTLNNAYGYSKNALFSVDFETGLETHKNQLDSFKDRLQFLKSHTDHEKSLIKITELEKLTIKTENCYEMILSQLDSNKNHQVKLNELFKIQSRLRTIREVEIDLIESTKRLQDNKQEILNSKALIHDDKKCISLTNDLLKNAEEIYKAETKLINKIPSLKSLLAHFK
ncbi:MAG: hypothetical protein JHC93_00005, partial [Parachlamydiales bacterium]|nr:hypothetical protein [Parachlamydiales bacterium]